MSEDAIHRQIADFLSVALVDTLWSTFPAGGGGKARGGRLKSMGLKAGWPDILLVRPPFGTLYGIEVKTASGRVGLTQRAVHAELARTGVRVAICRSVGDVQGALLAWGIPHRARLT